MQCVVPVVDALPKMDVRLDHPPTSATGGDDVTLKLSGSSEAVIAAAKPAPEAVTAFKGQILHWRLYCVSSGAPARRLLSL